MKYIEYIYILHAYTVLEQDARISIVERTKGV